MDRNLRALRQRVDGATRRLKAQQSQLGRVTQQADELDQNLKQVKTAISTAEHEAEGVGERVESIREKMNSTTSHKQYQAMLVEMNTLKIERGKFEDTALEQMSAAEDLEQRHGDAVGAVAAQQKLVDSASSEVQEASAEIADRLAELEGERNEAAAVLPEDVRKLYEKLLEDYDDEPVAQIEVLNKRRNEYVCAGCYNILPVERVNRAISRPDELVTCPNCGRILVAGKLAETAKASSG
ncbi:MAG: C4-type zinc ribbon domain-containing protein [Planctomycetota bacterium]